jgi:hypothetical protein
VNEIRDLIPEYKRVPFVYDLRLPETGDDSYFIQLARFTDTLLDRADHQVGDIIERHIACYDGLHEGSLSRGQAVLAVLTAAMAIKMYQDLALRVPGWVVTELQKLIWKHDRPTVTTHMLRSALFRTFMKTDYDRDAGPTRPPKAATIKVEELSHLIGWLDCTCDLRETARALANWRNSLENVPPPTASEWMNRVMEFYASFEAAAERALGTYTGGVSNFIAGRRGGENRRLDRFLRGRKQVEYHLAMLGSEIANRISRDAFLRCPRKIVLVPACMRGAKAQTCSGGQSYGMDVSCCGCDPNCWTAETSRTARKHGAEIYVENCPRNSHRWTLRWSQEQHTGFVIVACLPVLPSIQNATRLARMTCQFLPLDFPGCRDHWRNSRIPTTLNKHELVQLITGPGTRGFYPAREIDAVIAIGLRSGLT